MRNIKHIVVHASATREGKNFHAKDIDNWHKHRGWRCIGYHYVVNLDGKIEKGRLESEIGAHVRGYNRESIGVCYIGGLDVNGVAKDTRTPQQKVALSILLKELKTRYPSATILGHRDLSPDRNGNGVIEPFEFLKVCPCFDAKNEYKTL